MSDFIKIELNNNPNWNKVRLDTNWSTIILNPDIIYKCILDIVFDKVNLYYYATQRRTSKTLKEAKQDAKKAIKNGTIEFSIDSILNNIGFKEEYIDVNNDRFCGDFGELVMANLIDQFTNVETIICKVSLKTSAKMSAYGNDNVFYDYKNKILYYGESKFRESASAGLKEALKSLDKHLSGELNYIINSTNVIIAKNKKKLRIVEKHIESIDVSDVSVRQLIFAMNDDIYKKSDYEQLINKLGVPVETIIVLLPILSKTNFIDYIRGHLDDYRK